MPKDKCKFCDAVLDPADVKKSWEMVGLIRGVKYKTKILLYKCHVCGKHTRIGKRLDK